MEKKTVYLKNFGCQMNVTDSEQLLGVLRRAGYSSTDNPEEADLILLNTCAIRDKAEQKVFSELGRLRRLKERDPSVRIGVAGCVAQSMGEKIFSRQPAVDFVLGTRSAADLPELIREVESGRRGISLSPAAEPDPDGVRSEAVRSDPVSAYVPIIYGCDNYCSYCVVPYVRGPEWSRPVDGILREVRELAAKGYREITLLGQNVNSYGNKNLKNTNFAKLLHLIHEVDGIERIRFVTSHPKDLSEEVVRAMATLPKICEALHLPVQSGSDRILKAMNRRYTRSEYLERLHQLRESVPEIALTTDIIVGFPGETEKDYQETLTLISDVEFDHLFGFCFSPRKGTPAASLPDPVDKSAAGIRLREVFALQKEISLRRNRACVGKTVEVLVEGPLRNHSGGITGRSRTNKIVHGQGREFPPGTFVRVLIEKGLANCLVGTIVP